jgi:hypothetical protein
MYFRTGVDDMFTGEHVDVVSFVNATGTPPTVNTAGGFMSDHGELFGVVSQYSVVGDFTFTAYEVRLTVGAGVADVQRDYLAITSGDSVSFGVRTRVSGDVLSPPAFVIEPQVGACCVEGVCTIVASTACAGEFLGANSICAPTVSGGQVLNACCPADFDGDASLGVPDIFAFLSAWFSGCP